MKRSYKHIDRDAVGKIRELCGRYTPKEIAMEIGCSTDSVYRVLRAYNLTRLRINLHWTKLDDNKLVALFNDGCPLSEIAITLSRTLISVQSRLAKLRANGADIKHRQTGRPKKAK